MVTGAEVSKAFFDATGAAPLLGRLLVAEDFGPDGGPVILLHHGLWQTRFGGEPSIVGRDVAVDGRPTTVLGVMPRDFSTPERADFWMPSRGE